MFLQTKNSKKIIVFIALLVMVVSFGFTIHANAAPGDTGDVCIGSGFNGTCKSKFDSCIITSSKWSPFDTFKCVKGFDTTSGPAAPPASSWASRGVVGELVGAVLAPAIYIFGAVGIVLQVLAALFVEILGKVYDLVIQKNLNFSDSMGVIIVGWKLSRDITNMFFILILLFIAITTMLRVSGYETKVLLRKLIVMALLINFSLAAGLMIIDGTNVLGNEFYTRMTGGNGASLSLPLLKGASLQLLFEMGRNASLGGISSLFNIDAAIGFAKIAWGVTILLFVFAFIMFFAAILLLIRFAVLAFLLVIMPLAFLGYILPKTESWWDKWWSSFLSHAFFFPAHMFMVMFAILFTNQFTSQFTSATASNLLDPQNPALFLGFLIALVMLVGSLIIARQMAVFGSGTVVGWAKMGGKYIQASATSRTIGRLGEKIQTAAPNSYLASRVGGTMAGMGKGGLGGSRTQQVADKTKFDLASTLKKSMPEQLKDLKNSKSSEFKKQLGDSIIKGDKELTQAIKTGDTQAITELKRIAALSGGEKDVKKIEKAEKSQEILTEKAKGKTNAQILDDKAATMHAAGKTAPEISDELEKYFKVTSTQEQANTTADWQSDPAKVAMTQKWVNKLDPEDQIKYTDSIGKTLARDIDKLAPNLAHLPEDIKKSAIAAMSDADVQKMAPKIPTANRDAFYDDVIKHAPNRKDSLVASMPAIAMNRGVSADKVIPTINMKIIPAAEIQPRMKEVLDNASLQQIKDIAARKDLSSSFRAELNKHYTSSLNPTMSSAQEADAIKKDMESLAVKIESSNLALASWMKSKPKDAYIQLHL
ncbi:MAG: hypothetical protein Q8P07_04780 [bacterium]|nr:hypothetical protein [bacterium]